MDKAFKIIYGTTPATREQLDAIEEIVVEQEIGRAWEARIKIAVCIGEDGSWDGENDPAYAEFARVRIEVVIDKGAFVPLIDGTIQHQEPDYNAVPGSSVKTLVVRDDTIKLHREAASETFPPGQSDSEVASSLLGAAELGGSVDVDETEGSPDPDSVVSRHGTRMQLLREITTRNPGFHAYVLPGETAGTSDGCFKKLPETPDLGLPPMFLTGPDQNISAFRIQVNSARAATVEGAHLSMRNKTVTQVSVGHADTKPTTGENATSGTATSVRRRRLPPGIGDHTDLQEAATGAAQESAFTLRAEGSVIPACYGAVLSPYRMVFVSVSNSRYSTNYVIYKVVHTLGISEYTQQFTMIGNAVSPEESLSAAAPAAAAAIAGSAAVSFNIQVDIF